MQDLLTGINQPAMMRLVVFIPMSSPTQSQYQSGKAGCKMQI